MNEGVTINHLQLENVKRVAVFRAQLSPAGLTVIGGDNGNGKTSVLDAIGYLLGGERYRPTNLKKEGVMSDPYLRAELSNGLLVERKGKNSALTVTDRTGKKQGQKLLDSFVEELALDLPAFLNASDKDKAAWLLQIIGIGDKLAVLDRDEQRFFDLRTEANRTAEAKEAHAQALPEHHDAPDEMQSAADLVAEVNAVVARNAARAAERAEFHNLSSYLVHAGNECDRIKRQIEELETALLAATDRRNKLRRQVEECKDVPADESTDDIQRRMDELEQTNAKVRANLDKRKAIDDAREAAAMAQGLTEKIEAVRAERMALLEGAKMPLPGLSVESGRLTYRGKAWDCMSGSEKLRVSVAIVRALRPQCGFVLVDGLEAMDADTLAEFDRWLKAEGLQCIGTRVSKGGECTIIIEDGAAVADPVETKNEAGF